MQTKNKAAKLIVFPLDKARCYLWQRVNGGSHVTEYNEQLVLTSSVQQQHVPVHRRVTKL